MVHCFGGRPVQCKHCLHKKLRSTGQDNRRRLRMAIFVRRMGFRRVSVPSPLIPNLPGALMYSVALSGDCSMIAERKASASCSASRSRTWNFPAPYQARQPLVTKPGCTCNRWVRGWAQSSTNCFPIGEVRLIRWFLRFKRLTLPWASQL